MIASSLYTFGYLDRAINTINAGSLLNHGNTVSMNVALIFNLLSALSFLVRPCVRQELPHRGFDDCDQRRYGFGCGVVHTTQRSVRQEEDLSHLSLL